MEVVVDSTAVVVEIVAAEVAVPVEEDLGANLKVELETGTAPRMLDLSVLFFSYCVSYSYYSLFTCHNLQEI